MRIGSVIFVFALAFSGCGDDSSPTRGSQTSEGPLGFGPASLNRAGLSVDELSPTTTVADVLANPGGFPDQALQLNGSLVRQQGPTSFLFADSTGQIPMVFNPTMTLPPLEVPIRVMGVVNPTTAEFPAEILVTSWFLVSPFDCEEIVEVRARFSDPGFVLGNIVGLFLSYRGVPAGEKSVTIDWGDGTSDEASVGEGDPADSGLYDLEGVATHEYVDVRGTETKQARATLSIAGVEGGCARVRET